MSHLLIIGGSDAGLGAALRAREVNPACDVTVVVADRYPNYSICGLPFWLSGEIADWRDLAHRKAEDIESQGVHLLLEHTAQAIVPTAKTVTVVNGGGRSRRIPYDTLVIATGAVPARPPGGWNSRASSSRAGWPMASPWTTACGAGSTACCAREPGLP